MKSGDIIIIQQEYKSNKTALKTEVGIIIITSSKSKRSRNSAAKTACMYLYQNKQLK